MPYHLYENDLPDDLDLGRSVAIDTETLGLNPRRDRLCLVQLSAGDGVAHIVKIGTPQKPGPNLTALLADEGVEKIFHFARFDVAMLSHWIGAVEGRITCTKIASKLARTYTDRHSLSALVAELLGIEMCKLQQTSYWGAENLSQEQLEYAAADVLYLHQIRQILDARLIEAGRMAHAKSCFDFVKTRAMLDIDGFESVDIFSHQ